jgi:hypothetical protein
MESQPLFDTVLFPTDLSPCATRTLECIGEIPGIRRVVLLHVIDATHPFRRGWIHGPRIDESRLV